MTSLVAMYQKGAITADHLVVECLHMLDPENPVPVLDALPDEILNRMLDYTRRYRPDRTVTNYGVLPTPDQVDAARRWIEERHWPHTFVRDKQRVCDVSLFFLTSPRRLQIP